MRGAVVSSSRKFIAFARLSDDRPGADVDGLPGDLAARRQAIGYLYDKQLVHALFEQVKNRYGNRNGGYTRILRTVPRRGDNAEMAILELVD